MVQYKEVYSTKNFYKYYIRYLMISKFNFINVRDLPRDMKCFVNSDIELGNSNQVVTSWTAMSTFTGQNPVDISKIYRNKFLTFKSESRDIDALVLMVKLVHTLLVMKENLDVIWYTGKRKKQKSSIQFFIDDFPISVEMETFANTTEKKPFGNLNLKVMLYLREDRTYVTETFWRMVNLPLERK